MVKLTKELGRIKFNGHWETWYSQKVLPGKGLKIPGRHVDSRGLVCDGSGYICVATTLVKMGEKINTSLGMGKRYDTCGVANTVDIYTNW
jgi:hypothetical protein